MPLRKSHFSWPAVGPRLGEAPIAGDIIVFRIHRYAGPFHSALRFEAAMCTKYSNGTILAAPQVAAAPRDAANIGELMQAATEALRHARLTAGSAWSVFKAGMRNDHDALRMALPAAIANHEIIPYYQPIVDLLSGRVVGLEVVARWQHPARGLLAAEAFIAIAGEAGVLTDITLSLLGDLSSDAQAWPESLVFAIDIAASQLTDVIAFAQTTPAPPSLPFSRIEMELTETALMSDVDATRQAVCALRDRGTRVALSDFGTGHGNFHHLRAGPCAGSRSTRRSHSIVSAIIALRSASSRWCKLRWGCTLT
jgi:predicted signal transduction protein with EAL and GGDEF domain